MTNEQFILTFREADFREIYHDKLHYKLFTKDNYPSLLLIILFLFLTLISTFKSIQYGEYLFLSLGFLFGFAYQIIQLLKQYWQYKKGTAEIETWLISIKKYQKHQITFGESFFQYSRDNDVFTYDLKNIVKTFRTDDYLFLETMGNNDIVIPKNAFENGEYEQFILAFDMRRKKI